MTTSNAFVDRATLRALDLGRRLGGAELEELARKVRVEALPAGRQLFVRGRTDAWTYYLLEGEVSLQEPGDARRVVGGTVEARSALDDHQPRRATATAVTDVRFIRIHRSLLEVLGGTRGNQQYEVEEIGPDDTSVDNRLFHRLYYDFMEEKLELPHLPDVASRVQSAAEDPDVDLEGIARIIRADPILAARLIQAANSPLYNVQESVTTTRAAVMLLGLDTTRHLLLTYALRTLFQTDSKLLKKRMEALWRHCALTGAIAYALAERTRGLDPERAMLSGLLHDIGALPIIHYAAGFPEVANDAAHLEETIVKLKGQVGAMLLRKWGFSDEMVQVALQCDQWRRDSGTDPDYVDAVMVSQLIGTAPEERDWMPDRSEIPAFAKLGIDGLDEETEARIVDDAKREVGEVLGLFE